MTEVLAGSARRDQKLTVTGVDTPSGMQLDRQRSTLAYVEGTASTAQKKYLGRIVRKNLSRRQIPIGAAYYNNKGRAA